MKVTITIKKGQERYYAYLLRKRYGKDKRSTLPALVKRGLLEIVMLEAQKELDEEGYA